MNQTGEEIGQDETNDQLFGLFDGKAGVVALNIGQLAR
jgi:hypothetical protein